MPLSRLERQAVIRELAARYAKSRKSEKGAILKQVEEILGLNRHSAARALRKAVLRAARMPVPRATVGASHRLASQQMTRKGVVLMPRSGAQEGQEYDKRETKFDK